MAKCELCGTEVALPFECNFCGGHFCMEHRLPESHACHNPPERSRLSSYESKDTNEDRIGQSSMMKSEGNFHFRKRTPMSFKSNRRKSFPVQKIVGVCIIVGTLIVLVWQSPAILTMFKSVSSPSVSNPYPGYTKVTLVVAQPNSIQYGSSVYGLGYGGPSADLVTGKTVYPFSVAPPTIIGMKTYNAVQGATYNDLGLQIIVGEVHNDYLILWIKSTVP